MFNIKEKSKLDQSDESKGVFFRKGNKIFKSIVQKLLLRFNSSSLNNFYQNKSIEEQHILYIRALFLLNITLYMFIILRIIKKDIFDNSTSSDKVENDNQSDDMSTDDTHIIVSLSILIILNLIFLKYTLNSSWLNIYNFLQSLYNCCFVVFRVNSQKQYCSSSSKGGLCLDLSLLILVFLNILAQNEWIFRCIVFSSLFVSLLINQYQKFQIIDISLSSIMLIVSLFSIYYNESYKKIEYFENFRSKKKWQRWLQIFQSRLPIPTLILRADQNKESFKISFVNDQFKSCFNISANNQILNSGTENVLSNKINSNSEIDQQINQILQQITVPIASQSTISPPQSKFQVINPQIPNIKSTLAEEIIRKNEVNRNDGNRIGSGDGYNINQKFCSSQGNTQRKFSSRKQQDIQVIQTNQQTPSSQDKPPQFFMSSQNMVQPVTRDNSFNKFFQISLLELVVLFINRCQKRVSLVQQINDQEELIYSNCIYTPLQQNNKYRHTFNKNNDDLEEKHLDVQIVECYEDNQINIMIVLNDISMKYDNKRLYQMNDYKDKLLATVSHDLKTPLSAMISLVESCLTSIKDEEIKKILYDTLKVSDLLNHLINDIQDYGQIDNCTLKLSMIKFDLKECLKDILDIFEVKKRKGIDLILDYEPKIDNQTVGNSDIYEVFSDSQRLKQILLNLIGNAIKFTMKGFIKVYFEINAESDTIEIIVTDTGLGIPQGIQQKLFKEYKTFDTPSGLNKNGVGLGLYMCKKLAGLLGPSEEIKLVSKEGEGSSFSFVIYRNLQEKAREKLKYEQIQQSMNVLNENNSDEKEEIQLFEGEESLDEFQNQQMSSMISDFNQYNFQQIFQKSKFSMTYINKSPTIDNYQMSQIENNQASQRFYKNLKSFNLASTSNTFNRSNLNSSSELKGNIRNSPNIIPYDKNNQLEYEYNINSNSNNWNRNLNQSLSSEHNRFNLLYTHQQKNMGQSQLKYNNPNMMNISSLQFSPQHHSQNKLKSKNITSNLDRDIENSFLESQNGMTITKTPEQSTLQVFNKEQQNIHGELLKERLFGGLEAIQSQRSYAPTLCQEISSVNKDNIVNKYPKLDEESDNQKNMIHRITFECKNSNVISPQPQYHALQNLKDLKQSKLEISDMSYVHTNETSNQILQFIFSKQTNILVVDDEEIGHRVFQHQFKQFSTVKIESAYNGLEAIEKILYNQKILKEKQQQQSIQVNNESHYSFLEQNTLEQNDQNESGQFKKSYFHHQLSLEEKNIKQTEENEYNQINNEQNNENKQYLEIKSPSLLRIENKSNKIKQLTYQSSNKIKDERINNRLQQEQSSNKQLDNIEERQILNEQRSSIQNIESNNKENTSTNNLDLDEMRCTKISNKETNQDLSRRYQDHSFKSLKDQINQFKFIFMDFSMPIMDGIKAVQKIRELQAEKIINSQIYIFMVSGYDQKSDTIEFISKGADGIISKPVSQMKIAQAIMKVIDQK